MGKRREAVKGLLSLFCVAAVAFPGIRWWGHVKSNGDENSYCTDVFRVGRHFVPSSDIRKPCLNEAGDRLFLEYSTTPGESSGPFLRTKLYKCDNESVLFANEYGWWKSDDTIVKALTDRGTLPRAALDDCLGR